MTFILTCVYGRPWFTKPSGPEHHCKFLAWNVGDFVNMRARSRPIRHRYLDQFGWCLIKLYYRPVGNEKIPCSDCFVDV